MLTPAQVAALASEEGLGAHADDLVARVRPGWRLEPEGGRAAAGATKLGGHPDLAPDEPWPHNHRGIPLTFLAQIDCAALPTIPPPWTDRLAPWDHGDRLLRIFADLVDAPQEAGAALGLACPSGSRLERTAAPPIPDPWPPGGPWDEVETEERVRSLPEASVRLVPFLTVPECHPVLRPEWDHYGDDGDHYVQFRDRLRADGLPMRDDEPRPWELHHLLGEACSVQEDVRRAGAMIHDERSWAEQAGATPDPSLTTPDAWQVLLALHDDERVGLEIHDLGAYHVLAPVTDLAAGRHDRLINDVGSG